MSEAPPVDAPSSFLAIACAPGAEPWLKDEIAREHPSLRAGFARPGLVTFKQGDAPIAPSAIRSVFARVVASSIGPADGAAAAADVVRARAGADPVRLFVHGGPARPRADVARGLAPDERDALTEKTRLEVDRAIRAALGDGVAWLAGDLARAGDRVIDVFAAPGEPLWIAAHVHAPPMQPWPSGASPVALPADAPSRAYLKIEEAIRWAELPLRAGEVAVEIGSAPGGASLALLRRGLDVIGVDPGEMAPIVMAHADARPSFRHLRVPVGALAKTDLPREVDWIALDVNLAPPVALRYLERVVGPRRARLRGAVLTLKMNDAAMAAKIPSLLERVRAMGFGRVVATQLPTNRSEICVVALTAGYSAGRPSKAKPVRRSHRGSRGPSRS